MLKKALLMMLPLCFWSGYVLPEEAVEQVVPIPSARIESFHSDWTVFNANHPISMIPSREEITEKKKEFSFKAAETAREVTDSLAIPLVPDLIDGGSRLAREIYQLKKGLNKRHIHLDVSRDSAEVEFRVRF